MGMLPREVTQSILNPESQGGSQMWVVHALIPVVKRQEDQEFKANLGYIVSLRPAWAT